MTTNIGFDFFVDQRRVPLDKNTKLKREQHVEDNRLGFIADVSSFTGPGVPIHVHYQRRGDTEQSSLISTLKYLFRGEGNDFPNLSGQVVFAADRGYWGPSILWLLLSYGVDVLGTFMRQLWFPFTYEKKEPTKPSSGGSQPEFIPVKGPACRFQKLVRHSLGNRSNKKYEFELTATAFKNAYSLVVSVTLQSNAAHKNFLNFVVSSSNSARAHFSNLSKRTRFMSRFKHLVGNQADNHCKIIAKTVNPLTQVHGDRSGIAMRAYTCVSSVMTKVVQAKVPYIPPEHPQQEKNNIVATYPGLLSLLPTGDAERNIKMDIDEVDSEWDSFNQ